MKNFIDKPNTTLYQVNDGGVSCSNIRIIRSETFIQGTGGVSSKEYLVRDN
jgi:hypothetical protein